MIRRRMEIHYRVGPGAVEVALAQVGMGRVEEDLPVARRERGGPVAGLERCDQEHAAALKEEHPPLQRDVEVAARIVLQRRVLAAQLQERAVPGQRRRVLAGAVELAAAERVGRLGIRHLALPAEGLELLAPALAHGLDQRRIGMGYKV